MLALPVCIMECVLTGVCRVCATDEQPLTQIFNTEGLKQRLQIKIEVCLRISVHKEDTMPTTICASCAASLDVSYELVQRCVRGQEELQKRLTALNCSQNAGKPRSPEHSVSPNHSVKHEGEEADDNSDNIQPKLQKLHILSPAILNASASSLGLCRHRHSDSSVDGECIICGNLDVLADVVDRMQESASPSTSSQEQNITAAGTSSNVTTIASPSSPLNSRRRQLSCEFCAKEFHHTGDLNKHRRCHTGERPYSCQECGKKFAHVSNLRRHRKLHSGERPHTCPACQRSFSRSDKLLSHNCAARRQQSQQQ